MDYQNGNSAFAKKERASIEGQKLEHVSLNDVPLEVRRKEAKKPLFLARYE